MIFINMEGMLNAPLKVGDKVICYHMEGETSVPPGTIGIVTKVQRDPFEPDDNSLIISVNWENGSKLSLVSLTDAWKKIQEKQIDEQTGDNRFDFATKNPEIFENFDWKFLKEYLKKVQKAGPVNMFQAGPFLYSGKKWIDRYYGENQEDNEDFQDMLDSAEESKDIMIHGTIKWMESKGKEIDLDDVNRTIGRLSTKIVELYMKFY
jgi:hypothetical protein